MCAGTVDPIVFHLAGKMFAPEKRNNFEKFSNNKAEFGENKNLNGVSSLWRGSLQTEDDLKLHCLKIFRREFEERRGGVDLVSDCEP